MPPVVAAFGAISGAVSAGVAALSATTFGAFILQAGTSLALSALASALAPRPRAPQVELRARTLSIRQPVAPRELVYGFVRKGGTFVFMHSTGHRQQFLHIVIVLASHPVFNIETVYFDGVPAIDRNGNGINRWAPYVSAVEKAFGVQTSNPFPILSQQTGIWTAAHQLRGCAAIAMRLEFNPDAFPTGIPAISVDIAGKSNVFDPRTGDRRFTRNAALCLADYMSLDRFGLGAEIGAETGVDTLTLIEAANICDEVVPVPGGGTEARYACNGVVSLADTPREIIQSMLTAMAGRAVHRGTRWHLLAGAYRSPSVTFGPGDVDERGITVATRVSMRENCNGVRGKFISPENDWQPDDFPGVRSAVYVAEDRGEERWRDISLPFTISAATAQRLAKIELERTRRQISAQFAGKLSLYRATAGDTANLTFPYFGFSGKPFDVQSVRFAGAGDNGARLEVVLRETSPLVYAWDATEAQIYAAAPRTNLPSAFNVGPARNLQATEDLFLGSPGSGLKTRVNLTWLESLSIGVIEYDVAFRQLPNGPWVSVGVTRNTEAQILDVAPAVYEFRVVARSQLGVTAAATFLRQEIFGLRAPPQQLQNVTIQSAGGLAIIKWAQSADLDVRIGGAVVIRHSTNTPAVWANSVVMDEVAGAQAIAVVPLKPGSYLVRARDSSGVYGPAVELFASGAQALAFAPITTLQADPVFSGAKTDLFASSGVLTLNVGDPWDATPGDWDDRPRLFDEAGPARPSGLYEFAAGMDFGSVRRVRLRSEIRFVTENIFDLWDDRSGLFDEAEGLFDGTDAAVCDVLVEVRTTPGDPAGSPVWSGWSRLDSSELTARGVQARAIVTTEDGTFRPLIDTLRVIADEVAR